MKSKVLQAAKTLLVQLEAGYIPPRGLGVCYAVFENTGLPKREIYEVYEILKDSFAGWPHHSGNETYPIATDYSNCSTRTWRWEGEQRALRISLLKWAISSLELDLA